MVTPPLSFSAFPLFNELALRHRDERPKGRPKLLLFSPILFLIITKILTSPRPIMGLSSDQFLSDLIHQFLSGSNLIHLETELDSSGI
jgi:hypothetical protein